MLLHRQKLDPTWGTYQHFMLETGRAKQEEAQQNKNMFLGSSVLAEGQLGQLLLVGDLWPSRLWAHLISCRKRLRKVKGR